MGDKIAIMGAGALGSYVGAFLTREGEDVTFIDMWPEHVEAMRKQGWIIGSGYGKLKSGTIRIGHMGDHTVERLDELLQTSESVTE